MDNHIKHPIQLTFDDNGHTLHHNQIESFDENFLVFDTRNDDTNISETPHIKILDIRTKKISTIYSTQNQTEFGPGVGAATFSPIHNKVIFIHGIRNSTGLKPYSATRRTGVAIDLKNPNQPIFMDARNIYSPFTTGALRGGTHSHSWHENGKWISFTYNDFVIEETSKTDDSIKDQRVVGIMYPEKVEVPLDNNFENNSGEMFSIIVSKVVTNAKYDTDEIEKAFDECWIKSTNNIAFQGNVRDVNGNLKTEIFIASIPEKISISEKDDLEGALKTLPSVPACISQKRITTTKNGISHLRHWLRSSPDGKIIYFLMEDDNKITQLFGVNLLDEKIIQYTFLEYSITSPFNISGDGNYVVYYSNSKIMVTNLSEKNSKVVYNSLLYNNDLTGIPSFSLNGKNIYFNQFVPNKNNIKYIQIFSLQLLFTNN